MDIQEKLDEILYRLERVEQRLPSAGRVRVAWSTKTTDSGIELAGGAMAEQTGYILSVQAIPQAAGIAIMAFVKADNSPTGAFLDLAALRFLD